MRDQFYGYLNPESTKTIRFRVTRYTLFYGYLNPESTKTPSFIHVVGLQFYG